jgi:RNA polymerase sigma-70 factor (sigma-E family)
MDAEARRDFTAFVEARSAALFRIAIGLTGHPQQAEDLLQSALAKAYRHWGRVRDGHPEAYLRRAMYRQQVSWFRRPGWGRELVSDRLPEHGAADRTAQVDLRLALRDALGRLAPRYRAVLVLRYLEDLPDDEIAEILGCKPVTVRTQAARALDRVRELCPELEYHLIEEGRR